MSDDLLFRLRVDGPLATTRAKAADRIEALEREIAALRKPLADDALVEAMAKAYKAVLPYQGSNARMHAALAAITPHIRALVAGERRRVLEEACFIISSRYPDVPDALKAIRALIGETGE